MNLDFVHLLVVLLVYDKDVFNRIPWSPRHTITLPDLVLQPFNTWFFSPHSDPEYRTSRPLTVDTMTEVFQQ